MKILIVKLSPLEINDSANIRTLALARGLIDLNYEVDYLTIPLNSKQVEAINIDKFGFSNIFRTKSNTAYNAVIKSNGKIKKTAVNLLRKIYHKFTLYDYTYSIANKIDISVLNNTEYDIVISSSDPKSSHIAVRNLIKQGLKYEQWIQYWGDPLALDITNKSLYPRWYIINEEKKILSFADKIVYVSPFTLTDQKNIFPELKDKMYFLPIAYIEEKLTGETENDIFTIGYFGAYHSRIRNILPLYKACKNINTELILNIMGDSDLNLEQTSNISIFPRGDISSVEKETDLIVCLLNTRGSQIPGKIYHAAATDKTILVILDGDHKEEMKEYLTSFERFIICENTEDSISNTLIEIISEREKCNPAKQLNPVRIANEFIGF